MVRNCRLGKAESIDSLITGELKLFVDLKVYACEVEVVRYAKPGLCLMAIEKVLHPYGLREAVFKRAIALRTVTGRVSPPKVRVIILRNNVPFAQRVRTTDPAHSRVWCYHKCTTLLVCCRGLVRYMPLVMPQGRMEAARTSDGRWRRYTDLCSSTAVGEPIGNGTRCPIQSVSDMGSCERAWAEVLTE